MIKRFKTDKSIKPNISKYLDKPKGYANIIFTKQAVSKKEFAKGILMFSTFDKTKQISIGLGKLINKINHDNL